MIAARERTKSVWKRVPVVIDAAIAGTTKWRPAEADSERRITTTPMTRSVAVAAPRSPACHQVAAG